MIAITAPSGRAQTLAAGFLAVAMAATVGIALGFEHFGGYMPCKLCLEQRLPYYLGVPLMVAALVASLAGAPSLVARALLAVGALLMIWGLTLAVYHAGVEWAWWQGPTDCAAVAPVDTGSGGILDVINTKIPPSCDKAALRVLGLSFAGWNAIASLLLALAAMRGALGRA